MSDPKNNLSLILKKTKDKIKEIQQMDINKEDKNILISNYINKYKKYKENFLEKHNSRSIKNKPNMNENFFNFPFGIENKIKTEFNNLSKITNNINPENNNSYSYSYSSSTSSSLNPKGKTVVQQKETKNKNGKITTINNCYEIDSNGNKKIINCDKKENFEKMIDINDNDNYTKNDYGKKIKFNYNK